jgi:hypothetical protein
VALSPHPIYTSQYIFEAEWCIAPPFLFQARL